MIIEPGTSTAHRDGMKPFAIDASTAGSAWPQSDGWIGYRRMTACHLCFTGRDGQKLQNIARDPRVSIAIAKDHRRRSTSGACRSPAGATSSTTSRRSSTPTRSCSRVIRNTRLAEARSRGDRHAARDARDRLRRLDDAKGYGHAALVRVTEDDLAELVERRRHHWAGARRWQAFNARTVPAFQPGPAQEFLSLHRLLPARCKSSDAHGALAAGDRQASSSTVPGAPAPFARVERSTFTRRGARAISNQAPGNGDSPRIWSCTSARLAPVDPGLALVDLVGIGDAVVGLRRELQRAALQRAERAHHQVGAERAPARRAGRPPSCRGRSATRSAMRHGPGVEPLVHLHHHDAALGIARHDRAVDRRGAAPARQQRGMQVEAAERHGIEDRLRQDQPIGDDDRGIGAMRAESACASGGAQRRRRHHR